MRFGKEECRERTEQQGVVLREHGKIEQRIETPASAPVTSPRPAHCVQLGQTDCNNPLEIITLTNCIN
jgi:hypothetical protein